LIRVQDPSGEVWQVPAELLASAVETWTAKDLAKPVPDEEEGIVHRSRVRARRSGKEAPVRWEGELIGFAEALGPGAQGTLELSEDALVLRLDCGGSERWPLLDIRAVQTSSSSLQFSPVSGGLVEFKFPQDSPFRWEGILRECLRRVYRAAGKGEIVEFQPRIVTE
jgi:hypothetical protein